MRNLKRVLSLVMAMAMLVGMMMISASAVNYEDFTDADEIQHTEAVSVLTTLNVIAGKDDGSYDPTGSLTRAEMAKIVAYVMNGGVEPNIGTKVTPTYSDIDGHWAESYIEYCTSMGIIAGDGAGRFNPEATLTASQTAKMFLTAMGYNAEVFGFVGNDWEINANRYANEAGLYNDLGGLIPSQPISRDAAAQMAYNAIQAYMMERDWSQDQTTGQITEGYRLSTTKTLLSERFGVVKVEGVVTANEFTEGSSMEGKTTIAAISNSDEVNGKITGLTFNVTTGADELGKDVTMYVKPASSSTSATRATVLGSAIINSNNTIYSTTGALVDDSSKSNDITKTLKAQGLKFDDNNDVTLYVNYAATELDHPATTDLASLLNTKGVEAQYIDNNDDGIVDVVVKVIKAFGKVTVYSDAKDGSLSISKLGNYGADGTKGGAGLSTIEAVDDVYDFANLPVGKDDYAFYYQVNGGLYYVEPAESVTVNITATKGTSVYGDGDEYGTSDLASTTDISAETGAQASLTGAVTLGEDAVLYLDAGKNVVYVTDVSTTASYLMITATATSSYNDSLSARVVFEDGTIGEIEINKVDTTSVNSSNASTLKAQLDAAKIGANTTGKVYSYSVTSDDTYNLTTETTVAGTAGAVDIAKGQPTIVSGKVTANNATKFVLGDADGYNAYTGINNVSSKDDTSVFAVVGTNKVAKIIFAYGGTGAENANNYMYVLSKTPYVTNDGKNDVYTYSVIRNGEVTTIEGNSNSVFSAAGLNKVTMKGDKADSASTSGALIVASGKATTASEGVLTISGNGTSYFYDENTMFILITGDGEDDVNTSASVDSIITEGGAQDTISILVDEDNTTTAQYVFIERG